MQLPNTRPIRNRISTQIFTPSKIIPSTKGYVLNERRTAQKLLEATYRESDLYMEMKHGNLILQLTPATFLHFNEKLLHHFSNHPSLETISHDRVDKSEKLVERSISVKELNPPKHQVFRITYTIQRKG